MSRKRLAIKIKNYEAYQHYKLRIPPWIKLHLTLLDDPDFLRLPDASKWHYVGLILLASRHENYIQYDVEYIRNRLGLTEKLDLTPRFLLDHVLACSASNTLASSASMVRRSLSKYADSETETETETETERNAEKVKPLRASVVDEDFWSSLGSNPAYRQIDLAVENGKMDAWLSLPKNKHRKKTRQFVLRWLNKIERPVSGPVAVPYRPTKVVL